MTMLKNPFLYRKQPTPKSIYFWNAMNSICGAAINSLLLLVITRLCGTSEGGVFSIAITTGQLMGTIALYELRGYQVTDSRRQFVFSDYHTARLCSIFATILVGIGWIAAKGYTGEKAAAVNLATAIRMVECYADILYGEWQLQDRLDLIGKSATFRMGAGLLIFTVVEVFTHSLLQGLLVLLAFYLFWIFFVDWPITRHMACLKIHFSKTLLPLFWTVTPLFIANYIYYYIISAPKLAIDQYLQNETLQAYFGILFMPASIINLFTYIVYRLVVTQLSRDWTKKNLPAFLKTVFQITAAIAGMTVLILLGGLWLGIPALNLIYGVKLDSYKATLIIILLGGGFSALASWLNMLMTVMRKQRFMMLGYVLCLLPIMGGMPFLVQEMGLNGAALGYLFAMILLVVVFGTVVAATFYRRQKGKDQ